MDRTRAMNIRPPIGSTDTNPHPPFDLSRIIEIARQDMAFIRRIIREIVLNNRLDILELKASGEAADVARTFAVAHRIKGIANIIDAAEVACACRTLELACKLGGDAVPIREMLNDLIAKVEYLNLQMEAFETSVG